MSVAHPAPPVSASRIVATVAALAVSNIVLLSAAPGAWIGALFGFPVGLLYPIALLVAICALDAVIIWALTRRRNLLAGVMSALAGSAVLVAIAAQVGQIPIWWNGSFDVAPVVAGATGTLVGALFLPRWWARVAGGLALATTIAVFAIPAAIVYNEQQQEQAAADEASREQYLDEQAATFTPPAITEADDITLWDVQPDAYVSIVLAVTDGGGAMRIDTVGPSPDSGRDALGCWLLVQDIGSFDETVTMDHYSGVCNEVSPGRWEETDGTGVALLHDGVLVLVHTTDEYTAEDMGATHAATPSELSDAAEHLRIISRAEMREYLANPIQDKTSAG